MCWFGEGVVVVVEDLVWVGWIGGGVVVVDGLGEGGRANIWYTHACAHGVGVGVFDDDDGRILDGQPG